MAVPTFQLSDVMASWRTMLDGYWPALAPESLTQPILPNANLGTVLNVTYQNSSAPGTEQAILEKHSYGRQLGHLLDVVEELIGPRLADGSATRAMTALDAMSRTRRQHGAARRSPPTWTCCGKTTGLNTTERSTA